MHFSSLITQLSALAILLGTASAAVEIRFYSSYTCDGSYVYWYNIPANTCYSTGSTAYHAVEFFNVPSGAKGQVYTNVSGACSAYGGGGGSGTYCINSNWFYRANWFYSSKKLTRREPSEDGPSSTGAQYTTPEGDTRRITVAPEDFDTVNKLLAANDHATLAGYPEDTISIAT